MKHTGKRHSSFTHKMMGSGLTICTEEQSPYVMISSCRKNPLSSGGSLWTMKGPDFYFNYFVLLKNDVARGTPRVINR